MTIRSLTKLDAIIGSAENALRTLTAKPTAGRLSPAAQIDEPEMLSDAQRLHSIGLMRINHTGEVCAQALYQGQALTAKLPDVREEMEAAAAEEVDHLAWCDERITELGGRTSVLNPVFYTLSFGCLLYTSPSPRDRQKSRMPSSA